eukprot:4963086-Prymnesium_polylepis.1
MALQVPARSWRTFTLGRFWRNYFCRFLGGRATCRPTFLLASAFTCTTLWHAAEVPSYSVHTAWLGAKAAIPGWRCAPPTLSLHPHALPRAPASPWAVGS